MTFNIITAALSIVFLVSSIILILSVRKRSKILKEYNEHVKGVISYNVAVDDITQYLDSVSIEMRKRGQESSSLLISHMNENIKKRFGI